LSDVVRAIVILSAAAAVWLGAVLGPTTLRIPTIAAAAAAALASWRWPGVVSPIAGASLYLVPVIALGLTGRSHFSAMNPVLAVLLASLAAAPRAPVVPHPWRAALVCWALVVAVSWPIVALREVDFSRDLLWNFRVPTAAGGFPPPAVVGWIAHTAASQLIGLLWLEQLWATHTVLRPAFIRHVVAPLAVAALCASLLAAYQGYVDIEFLSTSVWPYLRRAGGSLMDANASGMLTAMWITGFVALAASARGRPLQLVGGAGAVAAGLATWCSGSRTALLSAVIGIAMTLLPFGLRPQASGLLKLRAIAARRRVLVPALAVVVITTVVLAVLARGALRPQSTSPIARVVASVPGGPADIARWLWNRDGYGSSAVRMIREFPISGIGLGTFHSLVADYSRLVVGHALPPDNAQNWYRHLMAELGIVGSAGWIAFVWLFAAATLRLRPEGESPVAAAALRGSLAGLAAASLLGMPAQHPAIILTFWTFAFWLLDLQRVTASSSPTPRTVWLLVGAVVAIHIAGTLYFSRHDLRVPFRAARFDFDYSYGFAREEGARYIWVQDHAVIVLRTPAVAPSAVEGPAPSKVEGPAPSAVEGLQLTLWSDTASERSPVGAVIRIDGRRAVRRTLRGSESVTEVVSVPDDDGRFVMDVYVSPASDAVPGARVALRWEFVR